MATHLLIVLSDPIEGLEDEYHAWYTDTHLAEIVATPGFVSAQRFRIEGGDGSPHGHLAIYEVDGDLDAARTALEAGQGQRTPVPDAMAPVRLRWWCSPISDRVTA